MRLLLFVILSCLSLFISAQRVISYSKPGDKVSVTFKATYLNYDEKTLKVPGETNLLFYNYTWDNSNYNMDTKDSLQSFVNIIDKVKTNPKYTDVRPIVFFRVSTRTLYYQLLDKFRKGEYTNNRDIDFYCFINEDPSTLASQINYAKCNPQRVSLIDKSGVIIGLSNTCTNLSLDQGSSQTRKMKGKLLTENAGKKTPIVNAIVSLFKGGSADVIDKATTDKYGDFSIQIPTDIKDYSLSVQPSSKDVKNVILANQDGVEISRFVKTNSGFVYRLIEADVMKMTDMPQEDIVLTFNKRSKEKDLKISESINYGLNEVTFKKDGETTLDKVVSILKNNPKSNLEVISHTDSQGDDNSNLQLSQNRSNAVIQYIVSKGIEAKRLKAVGKGEKEIRNRCLNSVDCSDKEHEYNRRTEFHFINN